MSKAFVQGKPRPSMPEVPEGMVKLIDHGTKEGRVIPRPLPTFPHDWDDPEMSPIVVKADRTLIVTEAEADYLLTNCGEAFSRAPLASSSSSSAPVAQKDSTL